MYYERLASRLKTLVGSYGHTLMYYEQLASRLKTLVDCSALMAAAKLQLLVSDLCTLDVHSGRALFVSQWRA